MYKDVKHLKKESNELKEGYKRDMEVLKKEIANKAEKEMLLDNQK